MAMFASSLNFTQDIRKVSDNNIPTEFLKKQTVTGLVGRELDCLMGLTMQYFKLEILTATDVLFTDTTTIVIPRPFLIDSIQKILLPFAVTSWMSIGVVVMSAGGVVIVLNFLPNSFHDHVIGDNLNGGVLNVWNVLLGGPQSILPRESLPRFLLATFVIFTFLIRTMYQGQLFNLLKSDINLVQLKTVDDLLDHKFFFYMTKATALRLQDKRIMERSPLR